MILLDSGLIYNMKSAYKSSKTLQAAMAKEKQEQCIVSLAIAKQFSPWSMSRTSRLTGPKVNMKRFFHELTHQIQLQHQKTYLHRFHQQQLQ